MPMTFDLAPPICDSTARVYDIIPEYIIANDLPRSCTKLPSKRPMEQNSQWRSEERKAQKIVVDAVEARTVGRNTALATSCRSFDSWKKGHSSLLATERGWRVSRIDDVLEVKSDPFSMVL